MLITERHPERTFPDFSLAANAIESSPLEVALFATPQNYGEPLANFIKQTDVSDIIVVGTLDQVEERLQSAFEQARLPRGELRQELVSNVMSDLTDFERYYLPNELEVQFQIRDFNQQPWHTDRNGSTSDQKIASVNLGRTLVGKHGSLCVLNSSIDRAAIVDLLDQMDAQSNSDVVMAISGIKDALCEAGEVLEIPVGIGFLFRTTRLSGLLHRPPSEKAFRMFMKVRERSHLTNTYLIGQGHDDGVIGPEGFLLVYRD